MSMPMRTRRSEVSMNEPVLLHRDQRVVVSNVKLTQKAEMTDEDKHTLAMRTVDDQASVTEQLDRFKRSLS
jgi:hypothetical protein